MGLIYCGGLGIYAVSGASLYDAFWQAVAGVGIDWTFTEEAEQGRGCATVNSESWFSKSHSCLLVASAGWAAAWVHQM